jgi:hypothetical protein
MLVHEESSGSLNIEGWSKANDSSREPLEVTKCGGVKMIGGYGQLSGHKL